MSTYFYDTYALVKLLSGEKAYERYDEFDIITTKLNLMELYYYRLRSGYKDAEKIFRLFEDSCVEIKDEIIFEAMRFKQKNREASYVDAIGYAIAQKEKVKFLTGDEYFRKMKNVEFQK